VFQHFLLGVFSALNRGYKFMMCVRVLEVTTTSQGHFGRCAATAARQKVDRVCVSVIRLCEASKSFENTWRVHVGTFVIPQL